MNVLQRRNGLRRYRALLGDLRRALVESWRQQPFHRAIRAVPLPLLQVHVLLGRALWHSARDSTCQTQMDQFDIARGKRKSAEHHVCVVLAGPLRFQNSRFGMARLPLHGMRQLMGHHMTSRDIWQNAVLRAKRQDPVFVNCNIRSSSFGARLPTTKNGVGRVDPH